MKIKKDDIYNFGLDYLEVTGTSDNFENIIFHYGDTDKYIKTPLFPGFEVKKVFKTMNYSYKIILRKGDFDVFAYHKGQKNGNIETKDFIAVYGTAFRVFKNSKEIVELVLKNISYQGVKRFDVAIDLKKDVKDVYKGFPKHKGKGSIFYNDVGEVQTFYIGEKKKSLNRRKLIRVYNKIDDIYKKQRQKLYTDYLKQEFITRVEIEFRNELCCDLHILELLDEKYIHNLFFFYIEKHTGIFSKIAFTKEKLTSLHKRVSIEELKISEVLQDRYFNTFKGYCNTILRIGACPVHILLIIGLVRDSTKEKILLSSKYLFSKDIDIETSAGEGKRIYDLEAEKDFSDE